MRIDALATEPHYLDHLRPVWDALPEERKGTLHTRPRNIRHENTVTLVTSFKDMQAARHRLRPVIMMEHGAGQAYATSVSQAYVGAEDRHGVIGVLVPNARAEKIHVDKHPRIPAAVVGCPKLDELLFAAAPDSETAAISFHWDCHVCPETRTALPHYRPALKLVRQHLPKTLGHAHPRIWLHANQSYQLAGIEPVERFSEVVSRASVYVCDNSSTMFEFAALGRPVVVLNAPWYRKDVHHGGRFWEWAPIGENIESPSQLLPALERAMTDSRANEDQRQSIVSEIYPYLGSSVPRAVEAVLSFAELPHPVRAAAPSTGV